MAAGYTLNNDALSIRQRRALAFFVWLIVSMTVSWYAADFGNYTPHPTRDDATAAHFGGRAVHDHRRSGRRLGIRPRNTRRCCGFSFARERLLHRWRQQLSQLFSCWGGALTTFDVSGADSQTIAHWANENGTIICDYLDGDTGQYEGFLRKSNGKIETLDAVEGNSHYTVPVNINAKNETVGYYYGSGYGTDVHAFLHGSDGTISQFDAPGAGSGSYQGTYPLDIASDGPVVGYYLDASNVLHGFIRSAGGEIDQFDVAGAGGGAGQGTEGIGSNNKGWITGNYIDANGVEHCFLRDPGGAVTAFDAADAGSGAGQGTEPIELNNHRSTTGWYLVSDNVYHGFLRSKNASIVEFYAPGA